MKPGDLVIHTKTGRRMTVKAVNGGNAHVLCCWMQRNGAGELVECSAAFSWKELRFPTDEERKNPTAEAPARSAHDASTPESDTSNEDPGDPSPSAEQQPEPMTAAVATSTVEQPPSTAARRKK